MENIANVGALQKEISKLEETLISKKAELKKLGQIENVCQPGKLTSVEVTRYSRQIILPEVTAAGQLKLKRSSVLIVGAGGLGCPAAAYIAGAGVGHIGVVDYDQVELSNLHRQILHTEGSCNTLKVDSLRSAILRLNSEVEVKTYPLQISSGNALDIIRNYDVVLDCTDNVATRYLLNDACVISKKPLVSGSALQFEGQLTIYNVENGPCYRCLFPKPPPSETVTNCGDGGVMGAVPGVIGSLQALEAVKLILGVEGTLSGRMLLFDASMSSFRNVKLRQKRNDCCVCSTNPTITELIDYEQFCGMRASDKDLTLTILGPHERVTVEEFKKIYDSSEKYILIDVRSPIEFEMCHLDGSVNVPLRKLLDNETIPGLECWPKEATLKVFFLCRRGNDSQIAVKHMRTMDYKSTPKDIIGGLHAWHNKINPSFPLY